ncbi:28S ribosomal protein S10, mitochondrial isoform X2 [Tachyglossus aculeatus]|uniref:28S ribosomal protein S10, mitochondrial isoform X2 n=1 Tax=Tachyglossus aculeatus TaxID=9261 RepID=UPI0018F53A22|nr:28S ribosomal protein S10, mitochondrial isoform X2 [Tachyglossus aculeatus]
MAARGALGCVWRRLLEVPNSSGVITVKTDGFLLRKNLKRLPFSSVHVDVAKDVAKAVISISDEPDALYKNLSVVVKGHDRAVLDSYEYFAVLAANELGLSIKRVYEPPRKIERLTLLKSVHIFKKHRVQYEMRTLYRCLETRLEKLPEHIKTPIWDTEPQEEEKAKPEV